MSRRSYTTTMHGLKRQSPVMRLYEKAKRFGIWNPSDLDFTQDKKDWKALKDNERDLILNLTSLFQAGEEAVTLDLLPLIMTIAQEGRLEEEMYLTTFLFEEAKHTDYFTRFIEEVAGATGPLDHFHDPNYRMIFYDALPAALNRLLDDRSPTAQVRASAVYNMIVEGVLAETGYHAYFTILDEFEIMPGTRQGIVYLKQDESRHLAYGIFLLSRLIAKEDSLWEVLENEMNTLLMPALGVVADAFARYNPVPFGLVESVFLEYAAAQFSKRMRRVEKARGASLDEIYRVTTNVIESGDA